ncbi:MAG: hypothetical protein LBG83_00680 [Oscillospiraceae bacterium]|jgi:hypothetical protein|nr:hypothetical protein [Oscillospiraceae bacterium]
MIKIATSLLIALLSFVLNLIPPYRSAEDWIKHQIPPSIVYVPSALATYPFKAKTSKEVQEVKARAGGYLKGVCHANDNYKQIAASGIEWNRADIPFPFEKNGKIRQSYQEWKARMKRFNNAGIKIFAVTPYPKDYIEFGVDPRKPENEARVKEIARFLLKDLKGLIGAIQVSNELTLPRFALPLTFEECIRFLGMNLEAMYPVRGNVIIGYNSSGPQADEHAAMQPYYKYCDYIGLDLYLGCFAAIGNWIWLFDTMLDYMWSFTGKPIIMTEFGYIGDGAPKTEAEKTALLKKYGASSEAEARKDIKKFVAKLPQRLRDQVYNNASGDWGDYLFGSTSDMKLHLYKEMPENVVIKGYPHTPEGQAKFYSVMLPKLEKKKYLIGSFIYCYSDSEYCYVCGQPDCPIETRWGLVYRDGTPKPAYYTVQKLWAKK